MIENVLVRHLSVASEAEKICAVECCEVEEEGGSESDQEDVVNEGAGVDYQLLRSNVRSSTWNIEDDGCLVNEDGMCPEKQFFCIVLHSLLQSRSWKQDRLHSGTLKKKPNSRRQ